MDNNNNNNNNNNNHVFVNYTTKSLHATHGRPCRPRACVACRDRHRKVSTNTFRLELQIWDFHTQCVRTGANGAGPCEFCNGKGQECVVSELAGWKTMLNVFIVIGLLGLCPMICRMTKEQRKLLSVDVRWSDCWRESLMLEERRSRCSWWRNLVMNRPHVVVTPCSCSCSCFNLFDL